MVYYAGSIWHVMEAVWGTILSELHRLATRRIHRNAVLALVGFHADMRLPLALEVSLLGGDSFLAAEQAIAAEVLVALLDKAESRFVPDEAIVQQLLQRGVDVALAFEQLVPLRHAALPVRNVIGFSFTTIPSVQGGFFHPLFWTVVDPI